MDKSKEVINVVFAGLGGQGVLKASDILAEAAFEAGYDVKKSEIHGMSQRGGSVTSDVRFGGEVLSPMVPGSQADYLVVLAEDQVEPNAHHLRSGGTLITLESLPGYIDEDADEDEDEEVRFRLRSLNVALLGALSAYLDIADEAWRKAMEANLPQKSHQFNGQVFEEGRTLSSGAARASGS
jgi:indolepyruvate ferredoxin oxidoreductase, beta subunit